VVTATEPNSVNYWERGHALRRPQNEQELNVYIPSFLLQYAQQILIGNALHIIYNDDNRRKECEFVAFDVTGTLVTVNYR
jgi:hypothetical protein